MIELEKELVGTMVEMLKSPDRSNKELVKAILEINPLDYSTATVSANIDKIIQLAEFVYSNTDLLKRFPFESYAPNLYAVAQRIYELLLSGEIRQNATSKDPLAFFTPRIYQQKIMLKTTKK